MKKVLIGAYSQIPAGSPTPVLERALESVFKPMLTYLHSNNGAVLQLYLSSFLMEWLEKAHPEVNMLIGDLFRMGRVELLTGSYDQSVLSLLSPKDRSNQIELNTTWIRKRYGQRSKTLWCYAQYFNPIYINTLSICCIDRVMISTFDAICDEDYLQEPFQMHELGKSVQIVPTNSSVGSLVRQFASNEIGFSQFYSKLKTLIQECSSSFCAAMVNVDQLCQGGITPEQTEELFKLLCSFKPSSIEEIDDPNEPMKRGYLEAGWYGHDCLRSDLSCFNDLFVKDESLTYLYGRFTSMLDSARSYRKDKDVRKRLELLLQKMSQGGPYVCDANASMLRSSIRKLVWRYIHEADSVLFTAPDYTYPVSTDYDLDDLDEYLTIGKNISSVVDAKGGSLSELTYLPSLYNYGDTFAPLSGFGTSQSLHPPVGGTKQRIFTDVFFPRSLPIYEYDKRDKKNCLDMGRSTYELSVLDRRNTEYLAQATCEENSIMGSQLSVEKHFKFRQNTVLLEITLTNKGEEPIDFMYGCEMPLSVDSKKLPTSFFVMEDRKLIPYEEPEVTVKGVKSFKIFDEPNNTMITLVSDTRFTLLKEDYSIDYKTTLGEEELYQHTLYLLVWPLSLSPGEEQKHTLGLRLERK